MACRELTLNPDRTIALEIANLTPKVEEGDTLRLTARALNAAGNVVPGAAVTWAVLDTGRIAFALDPSGLVTGTFAGNNKVQARLEDLRSDPVTVTVTPLPDSAAATGSTRRVLQPGDVQSPAMLVTVYDSTAQGFVGISDKRVVYQALQPATGGLGFFLTVKDTVPAPGTDPRTVTTLTAFGGQASAVARLLAGQTPPDSAIIQATAYTARGAVVRGTPVQFVVVFRGS